MTAGNTKTEKLVLAGMVAAIQMFVAISALVSSQSDPLSDMACIGGVFGTLTNLLILILVVVFAIVLEIKARQVETSRDTLTGLYIVMCSSFLAIIFGWQAATRCTV